MAERTGKTNGEALAAVLAAGIGSLAMGLFVILHEAGLYSAPSLLAGPGGLSGRSTFAVVVWLTAWGILHARWKDRDAGPGRVLLWTLVLVALALVLTFPPIWGLL